MAMSWKEALELYVEVGRLPGVLTATERALMARAQAALLGRCHRCTGRLPLDRETLDQVLAIGERLRAYQAARRAAGLAGT